MTKKILLFLLFLSALPITLLQAQTYYHTENGKIWSYTLNGNEATITGATNTDGTTASGELNIPSQIGAATVTAIGDNAFYYNANITKLKVPSSVTTIGGDAFSGCSRLTGILELPNVTTIGKNAFRDIYNLTGLKLPNVTTLGYYAFYGCSGLTGKLELPNVITISYSAFYGCSGLTGKLELPKVVFIGDGAFYGCSGLTGKLELPNVTNIEGNTFNWCSGLTGLELPNVTAIGNNAFANCTGLTGKLNLPSTLKSFSYAAFLFCRNLTAITFENGTHLTNIIGGEQFFGCTGLQYIDMSGVTLPTGLTMSRNISLFYGTSPYTMIYLPATAPAAESGEENFVIGGTCDKFVVYENHNSYQSGNVGCNYPIQHSFTANTVEYKNRDFSGATCKSLCLPYPATLPVGMTAYTLTRKKSNNNFVFTAVAQAVDGTTPLAANTAYLLQITDGATHTFPTENNVAVPVTPTTIETQATDGSGFYFGGTTTNIDNATAASNNYYNLENDTWRPISTLQPNGYVHSFRAYIRTTGGAPAKGFAMVLDDENTTTDIDNAAELTEDELKSGKHTFYTLDGRRVGTNYDSLKSGEMYVVKGQKFYKF